MKTFPKRLTFYDVDGHWTNNHDDGILEFCHNGLCQLFPEIENAGVSTIDVVFFRRPGPNRLEIKLTQFWPDIPETMFSLVPVYPFGWQVDEWLKSRMNVGDSIYVEIQY